MRVKDLGHLDEAVVLFGGAFSNSDALDALAGLVEGRTVVSTGDLLGFAAKPLETLARMRSLGWPTLVGKSEATMAGMSDFSESELPDWFPYAANAISPEDRDWLSSLPDAMTFVQKGRRYVVVGASEIMNWPVLWPSSREADFHDRLNEIKHSTGAFDGVVVGRSGLAFQRVIGTSQWIDVGTIGMPPHDGRPETRFAVLRDGDVTFERLSYDQHAAALSIEAAGLSGVYSAALESGIWPSEEGLPPELRRFG